MTLLLLPHVPSFRPPVPDRIPLSFSWDGTLAQLEATKNLAREFESLLSTYSLLDARAPGDISLESSENLSSVLSAWYRDGSAGLRDTAGVIYTGLGEGVGYAAGEVREKGVVQGVMGMGKRVGEGLGLWKGKGKGRETPVVAGRKGGSEGWKNTELPVKPK